MGLSGCSQTTQEPKEAPLPTVTVSKPVHKPIVEWDSYTGRLEAVKFVEVRSRISGYLEHVYFEEGQIVKQGDLLFAIDPRPFQAVFREEEAALKQAEARLEQARAQLEEASAMKLQTDAQLQLAESRAQRARKLNEQNAVTVEEVDARESELRQAQANVKSSLAGISSAKAAQEAANAAIASSKAAIETARLNLRYTRVDSPITGRISKRNVNKGNLVSGGTATSTLLTTITSIDPIYCTFDASEQEVLKYTRLDQAGERQSSRNVKNPLFLRLVDEDGFPHTGHMAFVDNRFDSSTASMRARGVFPNPNQLLVPGMFAQVRIPGSAAYKAVLIPDSAVGTDQSYQYVYVVVDGEIEQRTVRLGPLVDGLRVVREGLEADEELVIEGLLLVRPGSMVNTRKGEIKIVDDGLPDSYEPLPPDEWIAPTPDPLPAQDDLIEMQLNAASVLSESAQLDEGSNSADDGDDKKTEGDTP